MVIQERMALDKLNPPEQIQNDKEKLKMLEYKMKESDYH